MSPIAYSAIRLTTDCCSFQEVQGLAAFEAGLRILPNMFVGIVLNFMTGYFVNRLPALIVVLASSALATVAPLLMAVNEKQWPYWYDAFFAQVRAANL